jgi:hypothetical protein
MITKNDVTRIAESIGKTLTDEQTQWVIDEYSNWGKQDITATWDLIVEDMIYYVTTPVSEEHIERDVYHTDGDDDLWIIGDPYNTDDEIGPECFGGQIV